MAHRPGQSRRAGGGSVARSADVRRSARGESAGCHALHPRSGATAASRWRLPMRRITRRRCSGSSPPPTTCAKARARFSKNASRHSRGAECEARPMTVASASRERRAGGVARASRSWCPRYQQSVTGGLEAGARDALRRPVSHPADIRTFPVPGAFELAQAAQVAATAQRWDAIVCLGCLIKGETPHFDYIARAAADGIMRAAQKRGCPGRLRSLDDEYDGARPWRAPGTGLPTKGERRRRRRWRWRDVYRRSRREAASSAAGARRARRGASAKRCRHRAREVALQTLYFGRSAGASPIVALRAASMSIGADADDARVAFTATLVEGATDEAARNRSSSSNGSQRTGGIEAAGGHRSADPADGDLGTASTSRTRRRRWSSTKRSSWRAPSAATSRSRFVNGVLDADEASLRAQAPGQSGRVITHVQRSREQSRTAPGQTRRADQAARIPAYPRRSIVGSRDRALVAQHGPKTGEALEAQKPDVRRRRTDPGHAQLRQGELPRHLGRPRAAPGLHPRGLARRARLPDLQAARLRRLHRRRADGCSARRRTS